MDVASVIARLEEQNAIDLEFLRQCGEQHGDFAIDREDTVDSTSPVYDEVMQYVHLLTFLMMNSSCCGAMLKVL